MTLDDLRRRWETDTSECGALGILDPSSGKPRRGAAVTPEQRAAYERFRTSEAAYLTALEQSLYEQQ